jgi:hypothetical protein
MVILSKCYTLLGILIIKLGKEIHLSDMTNHLSVEVQSAHLSKWKNIPKILLFSTAD